MRKRANKTSVRARACDDGTKARAESMEALASGGGVGRRVAFAVASTLAFVMRDLDANASEIASSLYDFKVSQYGKERDLNEFKGRVALVVNVASE